jgi:competence protein ComEC
MVGIVELTSVLPSASIPTGNLETLQAAVYYLVLLGLALWRFPELRALRDGLAALRGRVPGWAAFALAVTVAGILVLSLAARPDGRLHVYFLDVGHGDATLIRSPEGHGVLVDGGPSPVNLEGALGRRMGFLDRGLDAVVLTGYGQDRLAGLVEAARRHPVGLALEPGRPAGSRAAVAWAEVVAEKQIPVSRAEAGQRVGLGDGCYLEVVWVSPREAAEPSLALRLVANGVTVLLSGDLPAQAQQSLLQPSGNRLDVLRVPGQGAASALDERLARVAAPRVAVISVAANNRYGHPADTTLQLLRNSTVLRTDRHGTIELVIDQRGGYEVYTER